MGKFAELKSTTQAVILALATFVPRNDALGDGVKVEGSNTPPALNLQTNPLTPSTVSPTTNQTDYLQLAQTIMILPKVDSRIATIYLNPPDVKVVGSVTDTYHTFKTSGQLAAFLERQFVPHQKPQFYDNLPCPKGSLRVDCSISASSGGAAVYVSAQFSRRPGELKNFVTFLAFPAVPAGTNFVPLGGFEQIAAMHNAVSEGSRSPGATLTAQ